MGLAVVARYYDLNEASIAASALRAAGLSPQVFDNHWASINWIAGAAMGGFRVALPEQELEAGIALLSSLPPVEPLAAEDVIERRQEAPALLVLAGAVLGGPEVGWAVGGGGRRSAFLWRRIVAGVLLVGLSAIWTAVLLYWFGVIS